MSDEFTFGGRTVDEIARAAESGSDSWQLDGTVLWRYETALEFAALDPRAQMRVSGITDGIPITWTPPRPPTRPPLWTRYMLGVREAERDRRLYPR